MATPSLGRQLTWRYGLFLLAFGALIALMALAERMGLQRGWIGASFLDVTVAAYASENFSQCRTAHCIQN